MLATLMLAAMAATPCEALKAVSLTNATITAAEFVPEGVYTPLASARGGPPATGADIIAPAHCRVIAVLRPSPDSLINMELWLPPADQWNGKFEAVGNGGWAGSIQGLARFVGGAPLMVAALKAGYATSSNDTGHQEANGQFTLGHPERLSTSPIAPCTR